MSEKSSSGSTPLREHVQRHGDDVDIAGALAIAEQRALDPVGARHQREFGRRDRGAAVVMRMHREDHAVAVGDVPAEPFELVGIDVRRRHLDRRRQVEDQPLRGVGWITSFTASQISSAKSSSVPVKLSGEYSNWKSVSGAASASALTCFAASTAMSVDALAVGPEHDVALQRRGRIVEVDDGLLRALDRLEGARDQFGPALGQHLDGDAVGNRAALDDRADEVEIGLRGRGKADLDLLEAHIRPAGRTCGSCARRPSARSAPGCRRADRPSTRSAPCR